MAMKYGLNYMVLAANEIPYSISIDNENNIFITGTATGNLNETDK